MSSPNKELQSNSRPVASKWNPDDVGRGQIERVRGKPGSRGMSLGETVCVHVGGFELIICLIRMEVDGRHIIGSYLAGYRHLAR